MTSLIQKGKESARTEITLLNSGALPLEKYGNEIKIERTISKNGQSAYKLATYGKYRKMKKNELVIN
jgi:chromosome segregation ATPase